MPKQVHFSGQAGENDYFDLGFSQDVDEETLTAAAGSLYAHNVDQIERIQGVDYPLLHCTLGAGTTCDPAEIGRVLSYHGFELVDAAKINQR